MSALDLLKSLVDFGEGNRVNYRTYNIRDNQMNYGSPPIPIHGIDYINAAYLNPQKRMVNCLTGKGVFLSNLNTSGFVEFGLLQESLSVAALQVLELTGIPFPLTIVDKSTGGLSNVVATACQRVDLSGWVRHLKAGVSTYVFHSPRMVILNASRQTM